MRSVPGTEILMFGSSMWALDVLVCQKGRCQQKCELMTCLSCIIRHQLKYLVQLVSTSLHWTWSVQSYWWAHHRRGHGVDVLTSQVAVYEVWRDDVVTGQLEVAGLWCAHLTDLPAWHWPDHGWAHLDHGKKPRYLTRYFDLGHSLCQNQMFFRLCHTFLYNNNKKINLIFPLAYCSHKPWWSSLKNMLQYWTWWKYFG